MTVANYSQVKLQSVLMYFRVKINKIFDLNLT